MHGEEKSAASYIRCQNNASTMRIPHRRSIGLQQDDEASRSNAGTGCNLQDVRSTGDMQPDKHNTKTAREERGRQPEQYSLAKTFAG